jgi:hypothetical protein
MSPEALEWAYLLFEATVDHAFPIVPNRLGWSRFAEFEYKQRAWAQTAEGKAYFAQCRELDEIIRRENVPDLYDMVKNASNDELPRICGTCDRLLTVPNPKYELAILGTDPPEIIQFSARILVSEPLRFLALFRVQWWLGLLRLNEELERIKRDPVNEALVMLHLDEGTKAELSAHNERVRNHLRPTAKGVPKSGFVAEDVLSTYLYEKELLGERGRGPCSFTHAVLTGKVASPWGYRCDLINAVKKEHSSLRTSLENAPEPSHESEVEALEQMTLEETGALLDGNRASLKAAHGERGVRIVERIYRDTELRFEEVAGLEETSLSNVERDLAARRERREVLNRRFELNWRPRRKKVKG